MFQSLECAVLVDHFLEACLTGEALRTRLSLGGLGKLTRHGLWPEAMRRVVGLPQIDPKAKAKFLDAWVRVPSHLMRGYVGDDDLFFAALRALTVPYDGPAITLWRGQPESDPVGMSWTQRNYSNEVCTLRIGERRSAQDAHCLLPATRRRSFDVCGGASGDHLCALPARQEGGRVHTRPAQSQADHYEH